MRFKDGCRQPASPTVVLDDGEAEYEIDNTSLKCQAQISIVIPAGIFQALSLIVGQLHSFSHCCLQLLLQIFHL